MEQQMETPSITMTEPCMEPPTSKDFLARIGGLWRDEDRSSRYERRLMPSKSLKSTKLAFGSKVRTPRKPNSLVRSRTLKRGCSIEPVGEVHFEYLWAAYKRGVFDIDNDLTVMEFQHIFAMKIKEGIETGDDSYIMVSHTPQGEIPVGMVTVNVSEGDFTTQIVPSFLWFPEASPRNILECTLRFVVDFKQDHKLLTSVAEGEWRFLRHLCKYGAVREVGELRHHYKDKSKARLFESVTA